MKTNSSISDVQPEIIHPQVSNEAEFLEIVNDFENPLEVLREAVSNAIDWGATSIEITCDAREIDGATRLVITILDNGTGMTHEVLSRAFWDLGNSPARDRKTRERADLIGEKGHGTKIYLRSDCVIVRTQSTEGAFEAKCEYPMKALHQGRLHQPTIIPIEPCLPSQTGTEIKIVGYGDNKYSLFTKAILKDYLLWFTKIGSVEEQFCDSPLGSFQTKLRGVDAEHDQDFEIIPFGHPFPPENANIDKLLEQEDGADYYVKKYFRQNQRLKEHSFVSYDAVIYVEGDAAKRVYNPMIRLRGRADTGRYAVRDRYGIWLCKDYIPIVRVNDWIPGFGAGSNAFVLLHGFVNCQKLKLTANRGTVVNTDPGILDELRESVRDFIDEIDKDLSKKGLYALIDLQKEQTTLQQEKTNYTLRVKSLGGRKTATLEGKLLLEPFNESELFGLFIQVYTLHPEIFPFEPCDYNTNKGIDIIARNKAKDGIIEGEFAYVELKYRLASGQNIRHALRYIRWIVCWDFDKTVSEGAEFRGVEQDDDVRKLEREIDDKGNKIYFLNPRRRFAKIEVVRLKELLEERFGLMFKSQ
jgi:hypothetical protein